MNVFSAFETGDQSSNHIGLKMQFMTHAQAIQLQAIASVPPMLLVRCRPPFLLGYAFFSSINPVLQLFIVTNQQLLCIYHAGLGF